MWLGLRMCKSLRWGGTAAQAKPGTDPCALLGQAGSQRGRAAGINPNQHLLLSQALLKRLWLAVSAASQLQLPHSSQEAAAALCITQLICGFRCLPSPDTTQEFA